MTELHLSELALDRARLGLLASDGRAHLDACARCRGRAAQQAAEDAAFIARHPGPPVASSAGAPAESHPVHPAASHGGPPEARHPTHDPAPGPARDAAPRAGRQPAPPALPPTPRRIWPARTLGVLSALAAAAVLAWVAVPALDPSSGSGELTRAKGGSQVELWIERDGVPQRFTGAPVRGDDTLVFRYTSPRRYLLVVSVEDGGARSVMVADARGASTPIAPGSGVSPVGAELDDSPHGERVYALLSDAPLVGVSALEKLVRGEALGADVDVVTWALAR